MVTPDSGFVLVGTTNGFGPGSSSIYLVRTDRQGQHKWSAVLGGPQIDRGYGVAPASDGKICIAGFTNSYGIGGYDGYLAQTDSLGSRLWEKTLGGSDWDFFYGLHPLGDGTYIAFGESYSFTYGGADAWAVRLNENGDTLWTRHFGTSADEVFYACESGSNFIYLCGKTTHTVNMKADGYLVKLDLSGNEIWEKQYDQLGNDQFNGLAMDPSENLLLVGKTMPVDSTRNEFWLIKTDSSGQFLNWFSNFNTQDDYLNDIKVLPDGELLTVGQKDPSGFGKKSLFAMRFDANLNFVAAHSFGNAEDEEGYRLVLTPGGGAAFAGYTTSYGSGSEDAYLVLIDPDTLIFNYTYISTPFTETLSPISVPSVSSASSLLSIYPNPVSDQVYFKTSGSLHGIVQIVSTLGDIVKTKVLRSGQQETVSCGDLAPGLYFYYFESEGRIVQSGKISILKSE